jgi:hypothetical protein
MSGVSGGQLVLGPTRPIDDLLRSRPLSRSEPLRR